jgi:hypothetical protein
MPVYQRTFVLGKAKKQMSENKASHEESAASMRSEVPGSGIRAWLKVGTIAAASALAGGLAAAWYYRKTLNSFREAESHGRHPETGIPDTETEDEI